MLLWWHVVVVATCCRLWVVYVALQSSTQSQDVKTIAEVRTGSECEGCHCMWTMYVHCMCCSLYVGRHLHPTPSHLPPAPSHLPPAPSHRPPTPV